MKNARAIILMLVTVSIISSCKKKKDPEPEFQFMKIVGGDSKEGKDWDLVHFYSKPGISTYDNTIATGIDGNKYWAEWIKDNYYTFYNNGYGVFWERGVINPQVEFETDESFDKTLRAYKYIQFNYQGGKTVSIVNRVQKPAFFDTWQIIKLNENEIMLYQQEHAFNQEHVIVFKRYGNGI